MIKLYIVATFANASPAGPCGSMPWIDHCFVCLLLQFGCSFDLCGSLLWLPILPI